MLRCARLGMKIYDNRYSILVTCFLEDQGYFITRKNGIVFGISLFS